MLQAFLVIRVMALGAIAMTNPISLKKRADIEKPHLVLLGAGASIAALPGGDKNGKQLPHMGNFISVLKLTDLLQGTKYPSTGNFEEIYSLISLSGDIHLMTKLQDRIDDYFGSLELPDKPTIYDHLVLSLREKDCIATFNWDPFLIQAAQRNKSVAKPAHMLFLHGTTALGVCDGCKIVNLRNRFCSKCHKPLPKMPLLYPISQKNYNSYGFIKDQWDILARVLKVAPMLTIFGYGAPKSDVEAVRIMKDAWGDSNSRSLEQVEIIDILSEKTLSERWEHFIHSHHYEVVKNFYHSRIAYTPRRTVEAYWQQFFELQIIDYEVIPRRYGFNRLHKWVREFTAHE